MVSTLNSVCTRNLAAAPRRARRSRISQKFGDGAGQRIVIGRRNGEPGFLIAGNEGDAGVRGRIDHGESLPQAMALKLDQAKCLTARLTDDGTKTSAAW